MTRLDEVSEIAEVVCNTYGGLSDDVVGIIVEAAVEMRDAQLAGKIEALEGPEQADNDYWSGWIDHHRRVMAFVEDAQAAREAVPPASAGIGDEEASRTSSSPGHVARGERGTR